MVGLPGQTLRDLAGDIRFFKELNANMIGMGPYITEPDTPVAGERGHCSSDTPVAGWGGGGAAATIHLGWLPSLPHVLGVFSASGWA